MRKITFMLLFFMASTAITFAGGGWATCAVSVTKDGDAPYLYVLNNETWTDGTWGSNTVFDTFDFGTPVSLVLNGGEGNGWTDDTPGYDATSFKIYYRVYESSATPGDWSTLDLDNQTYHNGNNYIYDKTDAAIDVLALATLSGTHTYKLEVVMTKNQYYTGGNWNSMVPGGQNVAYDATAAGYIATFTKSISTGIDQSSIGLNLWASNGEVNADFNGTARVRLFSITGKLVNESVVNQHYSYKVNPGIYLVNINGTTRKIVVQ